MIEVRQDAPVNPFRTRLYSAEELMGDFDAADPQSFQRSIDFHAYRSYVTHGLSSRVPYMDSIVRALHDNSITQAMHAFVPDRRIVGIMGGHRLRRTATPTA